MSGLEALARRRRMVRNFDSRPLSRELVISLIDTSRRAPSAGNTQGWRFLVLDGPDVGRYWNTTLPEERRASFPWPGLLRAPALVIPLVDPTAYVARYDEPDKRRTGLGQHQGAWSVPYWFVDGGAAVMLLLLAATDAGLGALLFGMFDHTDAVKAEFGVPSELLPIGTVALGHPAPDRSSHSTQRPRELTEDLITWGGW